MKQTECQIHIQYNIVQNKYLNLISLLEMKLFKTSCLGREVGQKDTLLHSTSTSDLKDHTSHSRSFGLLTTNYTYYLLLLATSHCILHNLKFCFSNANQAAIDFHFFLLAVRKNFQTQVFPLE